MLLAEAMSRIQKELSMSISTIDTDIYCGSISSPFSLAPYLRMCLYESAV